MKEILIVTTIFFSVYLVIQVIIIIYLITKVYRRLYFEVRICERKFGETHKSDFPDTLLEEEINLNRLRFVNFAEENKIDDGESKLISRIYLHENHSTTAAISIIKTNVIPYHTSTVIRTYLEPDHSIYTDKSQSVSFMPNSLSGFSFNMPESTSTNELWSFHQRLLKEARSNGFTIVSISKTTFDELEFRRSIQDWKNEELRGLALNVGDNTFRHTFKAILIGAIIQWIESFLPKRKWNVEKQLQLARKKMSESMRSRQCLIERK